MNIEEIKKELTNIGVGKIIGKSHYLAVWQLEKSEKLFRFVLSYVHKTDYIFNIFKFNLKDNKLTLLYYPEIHTAQFPDLILSCTIDLNTGEMINRRYKKETCPILHRKEIFINKDIHSHFYDEAVRVTKKAEKLGLFNNPKMIGYKHKWEDLKRQKGVTLL